MLDFVSWLEHPEKGFYTRQSWDMEKGRWKGMGKMILFPHQKKILERALKMNEETGMFDYETVLYSCVKKSGKTAIAAAVGAWYAEEVGYPGTEIYCIANDLDSAEGRVMRDIKFHFEQRIANRDTFHNKLTDKDIRYTEGNCHITTYRIELVSGTFIQALAQSYKAVAGSRHSLTLWDELWGVTTELSRRVWDEMTPIPTVAGSLRFIATYAGFENESDLLWDLYIKGVDDQEHEKGRGIRVFAEDLPAYQNKRQFTFWDHEPRLPWQTDEYYEQQLEDLRPAAFARLHMNQWVTSHEAFIPIEWYDYAAKSFHAPATLWEDHPYRHFPITVGVDAGQKRDSTSIVGVGYDAHRGKVGLAFHKIWTPTKDQIVDLDATVEKELKELKERFNIVKVLYDPTHLLQTMLRLSRLGMNVQEFPQTIPNMTAASQLLYDLFKNKNFEAYVDDELRRHIQMAVAQTTSRGFRIVKTKANQQRHNIDAAIATALACYGAVKSGGVDISIPLILESPFSDATAFVPTEESALPFELRS